MSAPFLRTLAVIAAVGCLHGAPLRADASPSFSPVELAPLEQRDGALRVIAADGTETVYTAADLEALPTYAIVTTTPWDPEPLRFEGVMLTDLLARHGLTEVSIEVLAENDFVTQIEVEATATGDFMIATRVEGHPLSRRERGPLLFVVPSTSLGEDGLDRRAASGVDGRRDPPARLTLVNGRHRDPRAAAGSPRSTVCLTPWPRASAKWRSSWRFWGLRRSRWG